MAQRQKEKKPAVTDEESAEAGLEPEEGTEDALARVEGESEESPEREASDEDDSEAEAMEKTPEELLAAAEGDDLEEEAAGQLGSQRYVLAGFFVAGMVGAFVVGRAIQTIWAYLSNKDWFSTSVPRLAAVSDDEKSTISLVIGALIALVVVFRTYRKPEVRVWTDEVASELAKVKWPTRKEVWNSTVIVIAASTVATVYLALLDRLWAFITNIVYGDGS
ncbi:MAG: preprotein translocase subunit SecE [Byssovorax sp.]